MSTPFEKHGVLRVNGAYLTDEKGEVCQLYGMSTLGVTRHPEYINFDTFKSLRDDWKTNSVRLAMYTAEENGYCTDGDKEATKELVKKGVEYATELGMYVIVDWHILREGSPLVYKEEAIAFFDEMSKLYADRDNVIYEICNEPNTNALWADVKAYADEVIPVIRANKENAVILVGTPTWSQDVDHAAADPLDFDNIMYVLHFYAATHKQSLRDKMEKCVKAGLPVFISEFGICDASGNGALDYEEADKWRDLIEKYDTSFFCWNLANHNESSSVFKVNCKKICDWEEDDLSDQGKWVREWFVSKDAN